MPGTIAANHTPNQPIRRQHQEIGISTQIRRLMRRLSRKVWTSLALALLLLFTLGAHAFLWRRYVQSRQTNLEATREKEAWAQYRLDEALANAAATGDRALVLRLVKQGANLNPARVPEGRTPLIYASVRGDNELILELVDRGAAVNWRNSSGRTALFDAAGAGRTETVELLLSLGADVTVRDERGETALMWAARWARIAAVDALLEAGADPTAKDDSGRGIVWNAERSGSRAFIVRLKKLVEQGN